MSKKEIHFCFVPIHNTIVHNFLLCIKMHHLDMILFCSNMNCSYSFMVLLRFHVWRVSDSSLCYQLVTHLHICRVIPTPKSAETPHERRCCHAGCWCLCIKQRHMSYSRDMKHYDLRVFHEVLLVVHDVLLVVYDVYDVSWCITMFYNV